jgi:capsular exopolysaccharide synthesis family protein
MGPIDQALQRASDVADVGSADTVVQPTTEGTDAFVSPWTFGGDAPTPAGVTAPPSEVPTSIGDTAVPGADGRPAPRLGVFRGFDPDVLERLVISPSAAPNLTEQYRRMAAALHHAQLVQGTKVLMVTSAMPGDGKSYTATNLALTLSESYRRTVLLIDADLRRPSLHEIFRVPNVSGLNEGLKASDDEPLSALKITETLTLLPAGRPEPDPMGGLSSPRMARIIQEGAARFDWVLIDTAPIGLLADAHLLATTVDGALLVVRANQTPYAEVAKALEALGRERVFGVVLNGAESSPVSSYSRYASAVPGPPAPTTPVAR